MNQMNQSIQFNPLIRREIPGDRNPWLQFQVGIAENRFAVCPVFAGAFGAEVVDHYVSEQEQVRVFTLKGFGATMEQAETMAGIPTTVNAMSTIPKL
jgi:hypothetical protein